MRHLRARPRIGRYRAVVGSIRLNQRYFDGDEVALRSLALEAVRAVEQFRDNRGLVLGEHVRRTVRRKIEDLSGTRPVVEVSLVQVD